MDMWKPFRVSTQRHAPKAAIMFDKFHIVKHLGDALDAIRRSQYKRVTGEDRSFIKGQRYVLLSRREKCCCRGAKSAVVAARKPDRRQTQKSRTPLASQRPPEHRLSSEGAVRVALHRAIKALAALYRGDGQ
jgi:transposase